MDLNSQFTIFRTWDTRIEKICTALMVILYKGDIETSENGLEDLYIIPDNLPTIPPDMDYIKALSSCITFNLEELL